MGGTPPTETKPPPSETPDTPPTVPGTPIHQLDTVYTRRVRLFSSAPRSIVHGQVMQVKITRVLRPHVISNQLHKPIHNLWIKVFSGLFADIL
jgi:hypothetical protein